eukprot:gb/GECG01016229.1/.p1 GENE.gb/GECG01016229.1/~~gb/GECG01016229.1/.p1  ORF type:complete len:232 (+),score=19.63 gb/GECG01016229.1/:1-696(+)
MASMPETREEPKLPKTLSEQANQKRLIVVLQQASLEAVKTKKGYELLNCDDHQGFHKKHGRDPAESRPDITHQLLLTLLDSPLNKAGKLQVYIETKDRTLIEVSPHVRIPRTFKRFCGLMVQLLHKMKVSATAESGTRKTLLRVVKNPFTQHLPPGTAIYGTHMKGELVDPLDLAPTLPDGPLCFVFGAMSQGFISGEHCEKLYSFSQYPLSASTAVNRLLSALERTWGIL